MDRNLTHLPTHVAVIMDGNGRWARERGLTRIEGHRAGSESVKEVVRVSADIGIRYLTLYAFSVENWQRPRGEVEGLMAMLKDFLDEHTSELVNRRIHFRAFGRTNELPASVRKAIANAEKLTADFNDWNLSLALNYGSRTEVVDAAQAYAKAVADGRESADDCSWERFSRYLYTADLPDPDLIVRTSGETRLSNFLLLQGAYAEIFFSPVLWPDFRRSHYMEAIEFFAKRERRFGRTGEQISGHKSAEPVISR